VIDLFRRAQVGLIIHLGDVNSSWVLDELAEIAPLLAVVGNNDDDELQDGLPQRIRFTVGKHTFGALHGDGGRSAKDQVKQAFGGKVDLAMFGHSHIPFLDEFKGTVLFNPGSATDRRWHEHFGVGIVQVTEDRINPELILYANPEHLNNISFEKDTVEPQSTERGSS
jgi:putative phosphoesterase